MFSVKFNGSVADSKEDTKRGEKDKRGLMGDWRRERERNPKRTSEPKRKEIERDGGERRETDD